MTQAQIPVPIVPETSLVPRPESKAWRRVANYVGVKSAILMLSVAVGLYLTILVSNLGGAIDKSFRAEIAESEGLRIRSGWLRELSEEERARVFAETQYAMEEALEAYYHDPVAVILRMYSNNRGSQPNPLPPTAWPAPC